MAIEPIYDDYCRYCIRLGIQPMDFDHWRVIAEAPGMFMGAKS